MATMQSIIADYDNLQKVTFNSTKARGYIQELTGHNFNNYILLLLLNLIFARTHLLLNFG